MALLSYYRCARCGEIVSISFTSYCEDDETVRELEATEKCFSCGYIPFRVRELLTRPESDVAVIDWLE